VRHSGWQDTSRCLDKCRVASALPDENSSKKSEIKKHCWCTDEFECPVKTPQVRRCEYKPFCKTDCAGWQEVSVSTGNAFPRYDGRAFDAGCREEKLAILAKAKLKTEKAVTKTKIVGSSASASFNGLMAYSEEGRRSLQERRHRGLQDTTKVSKVDIPMFAATSNGG
jgi:hypothetical protein